MNVINITLPWPPTVNTYFSHVIMGKGIKQRVVTIVGKKGKEYQRHAACELLRQRVVLTGLEERLSVHIKAYPPDRRKRDLDNLPKGVLDALTKAEVWRDDSQIDDLHITRGHIVKGGLLEITIQSLEH
jgi:crossover junction endodeoxyribonuclease RusA